MAKETMTRTIIYVGLAAGIVLTWGIAFGFSKAEIKHVSKQANGNTTKIEVMDDKVDSNKEMLVRIETRQEVVIKGIDEIKAELKK